MKTSKELIQSIYAIDDNKLITSSFSYNETRGLMIKFAEQFIDLAKEEYKSSINHSGVINSLNKIKELIK
jgi:hypothetical protein